MIVQKEDILKLIPQRDPFVLIDGLMEHQEEFSITSFEIKSDHYLVENNRLSPSGVIENIAQSVAARAGYHYFKLNKPAPVGFIGAVSKFELNACPEVASEINTKITPISSFGPIQLVKGEVFLNDKIIASCELKIAVNEEEA